MQPAWVTGTRTLVSKPSCLVLASMTAVFCGSTGLREKNHRPGHSTAQGSRGEHNNALET